MGFLDRVIGAVNKADEKAFDLEHQLTMDRRYGQAERLAAEGVRDEAVVTGIHRKLNDGTTQTSVRLEWLAPEPSTAGILLGSDQIAAIRLGATVAIRTEDGQAVLDWEAMRSALGLTGTPGQRRSRRAPDQGIEDSSLDTRVLSRLKKWTPGTGTVQSIEQSRTLGMLTENWTIGLTRADGPPVTVSNDHVPSYARWYVAAGAGLPIVVDPKDATRAQVDWARLAEERAVDGGRWQDRPPPGSIAAGLHDLPQEAVAEQPSSASFGGQPDPAPASADPAIAPIEGVDLDTWAHIQVALTHARIPPAAYDDHATEHHGVPVGRWTAIDAAWNARVRSDWKIGAKFGEAYEAAEKELKRQRKQRG